MKIQENISLAAYTTFKIGGPARFFCTVTNEDELVEAVKFSKDKGLPLFILGGGSNILVDDKGFEGLVLKMEMKGILNHPSIPSLKKEGRNADHFDHLSRISAASGENWDDLVAHAVSNHLYGIENLSAIPGTVGAGPVQNIGAYGSEIGHTIASVRVLDTLDMKFKDMSKDDCDFSYRDSVFKHEKGRYIITRVDLSLSKEGKINISYKDLKEFFAKQNNPNPTIEEVRQAVITIRSGKFPDLQQYGTAGSFFKNPFVSKDHLGQLLAKYPYLPNYPEKDGRTKVSLGWILDKVCNAKGLTIGNVRTYEKQALVLIAEKGANTKEVNNLADELAKRVKEKTGIAIDKEVESVS